MKNLLIILYITIALWIVHTVINLLSPFALPEYFLINTSILTVVVFYAYLKYLNNSKIQQRLTSGALIIPLLLIYMVVGSLGHYLMSHYVTTRAADFNITQKYWIVCVLFFLLGYFVSYGKNKITQKRQILRTLKTTNAIILLLVLLSTFATFFIIFRIGFVPIAEEGAGLQTRYSGEMTRIASQLWRLNIVVAVVSFNKGISEKKYIFFLITLFALAQLSLFVIRVYLSVALFSIFFITIYYITNKRKLIVYLIITFFVGAFGNSIYLSQRRGIETYLQREAGGELSYLQTTVLTQNFNEFRQMAYMMDVYDDYLYGKTLLIIPLDLFRGTFWDMAGVNKPELMEELNSARITNYYIGGASIRHLRHGLRIGSAGEFYINFSYYGAILFVFWGLLLGYFDKKISSFYYNDIRKSIFFIFQGIMVYTLFNAQLNAVTNLFYYFVKLYLLFYFLSYISNNTQQGQTYTKSFFFTT